MNDETTTKRRRAGDDSAAFQRRKRPVRVRKGVWDWRSWPWRGIALGAALAAAGLSTLYAVDGYVESADRFRFPSDGSGLLVSGLERLDPEMVSAVFQPDFGKPLATLALEERRLALLEEPWIRRATIARIWPDRIWADFEERRPVAFARLDGGRSALVDGDGVLLDPLPGQEFKLPAVDGIARDTPIEERVRRLRVLESMVADLDSAEPAYSEELGQIDLADPENVKATTVHDGDVIELQLGDELFRHRFEVFLEYVGSWKEQFGKVGWVDLRFEGQVVIQPLRAAPGAEPHRQGY